MQVPIRSTRDPEIKIFVIILSNRFVYLQGAEIKIKMYPEQDVSHVTVSSNATVICEASGLGGKAVTWSHLEKQIANVAADTVIFSV